MRDNVSSYSTTACSSSRRRVRLLIVAIVLVTIVALSCASTIASSIFAQPTSGDSGTYSATIGDYQLTVDRATLNFAVANGQSVWNSGERYSQDDGLNDSWSAILNDAFTIGYVSSNNVVSQKAMSQLGAVVQFDDTSNGFDANITCSVINSSKTVLLLSFDMQWKLIDDSIVITILGDSIVEYSDDGYSLMYIIVYPFFNASYGLSSGYIFVPDGSGAVIDTSVATVATKAYVQRVYGDDLAVSGSSISSTSPMSVYMGVYGIVNDYSSALVSIDKGAEYAEINAMVSGVTTQYNVAYVRYIYRQLYTSYSGSSGSDGDSYVTLQSQRNQFDIVQSYHLLVGDSSIGQLAQCYQQHLLSNGDLTDNSVSSDTSLRLLFLVYESKSSMFGSSTVTMTNFDYLQEVIEQYQGSSVVISLMGIDKDGMLGSYPFDGEGISNSISRQITQLAICAQDNGITLSLNADFSLANDSSSVVGTRDRCMSSALQFVYTGNRLDRSLYNSQYYLLTMDSVLEQFTQSTTALADVGYDTLEINTFGWMLYSSYDNQLFDRSDMVEGYSQYLQQTDTTVALDMANQYMWQYASYMYNVPTQSSQFVIESYSVPFLQMVLSGYVDCYSTPINLDYKGHTDILNLIEYNTFMSYVLTEQDSLELYGTDSQYIFSSQYSLWSDHIDSYQLEVSSCLDAVRGCQFVEYYQPQSGISICGYSNGVDIVINYTTSSYVYNNVVVPANSALAVG